jgi:hypothetical protein
MAATISASSVPPGIVVPIMPNPSSSERRLCETVAGLAATNSWTDQTVDPQRRAPAILWKAVVRTLAVERQHLDAQIALGHEFLQTWAKTLARPWQTRRPINLRSNPLRLVVDLF